MSGAAMTGGMPRPWSSFYWLCRRECHRVLKLWTQTTLAPVVSSLLFIVVFGFSLGNRINEVQGFPYEVFIGRALCVPAGRLQMAAGTHWSPRCSSAPV
jgi:ABC-2 type transport system permease protein